jgi:hypothetical protein
MPKTRFSLKIIPAYLPVPGKAKHFFCFVLCKINPILQFFPLQLYEDYMNFSLQRNNGLRFLKLVYIHRKKIIIPFDKIICNTCISYFLSPSKL